MPINMSVEYPALEKQNMELIMDKYELLAILKEITQMAERWSIKGLTPTIFKAQEAIRKYDYNEK